MKKLAIPLIAFLFALMVVGSASAQTLGNGDVEITCSEDTYTADLLGNIDIYCYIDNVGSVPKNLRVGSTFDDWNGLAVDVQEVYVNGSPISFGLTHLPPQAGHVRDRVLSNQVYMTSPGETTELHVVAKVPVPSQGKFDVSYGDPDNPGVGGYVLDPWWNVSWSYKACWDLSGHTRNLNGSDVDLPYGYPFNLTMNTQNLISGGKMQGDCDDLRVLINDTEYVPFFVRDCNETISEIWGAWNFTVGESYEACVYYGNPSASNNMTNRFDIVYAYEDFGDYYAFNPNDYKVFLSSQSGRPLPTYQTAVGGTGNYELQAIVSSSGGNSGVGFLKNDTYFNLSKVGIVADVSYYYRDWGTEWVHGQPITLTQASDFSHPEIYSCSTCHYAHTKDFNNTNVILRYDNVFDVAVRGYPWNGTTGGGYDYYYVNTSNLVPSNGIWTRLSMLFDRENATDTTTTAFRTYGDYAGQPYTDEILGVDHYTGHGSLPGLPTQPDNQSFMPYGQNATMYWSVSVGGGSASQVYGAYDFWFARPFLEGEPLITGGDEIPLDNGTLAVQFVSPTPANGSTVSAPYQVFNVSANKTVEWCKLDWNGANYTMTTDTTYCYLSKFVDPGYNTYKVWVEDYWGYEEVTETRAVTGTNETALLGVGFNVSDIQFASDTYILGATVDFNTSLPETDLVLMTSLNVKKVSGNTTNEVWARVKVDGNVLTEEVLRTVDTVGDEGSTGISPTAFNLTAGSHNITVEFKRSGDGIVEVSDIDMSMGQLLMTTGGVPMADIESGNFTHTATDYVTAHNFSLVGLQESDIFMAMKITVESDNFTRVSYAFQNLDNLTQISPYGMRYLSDAGDIGSMAGSFIAHLPSGDANFTVLAKNFESGRTTDVNYTAIWFALQDNYTKTVDNFQVTHYGTNDTESINVTDSWTLIGNATQTVHVGDGYFMGMYATANSPMGNQTITYKINATGTTCETKKERFMSNGNDFGLIYMWYMCENLTVDSSYDFELWAKAESGMWFDHYDESFAGFEVQSFDIDSGNVAPFQGSITEPENGSVHYATVNITWTQFSDPNGNLDDYNVTLWNDDWTFNQTLQGSTTDLYHVFDTSTVSDESYYINVEACDTEPLCTNSSVFFTVQSLPDYTEYSGDPLTTDFTAVANLSNVSDPVLANTYAIINWSGSDGFNVQGQNLDYGVDAGTYFVYVNSTYLTTFNKSAIITLRQISFPTNSYYKIYKDGVLCTDCVKLGYSPVQFSVTGFSNYSVEGLGGVEGSLTEAGSGIGSFLSLINDPLINIVMALGVIGGILAVFYGIGSVIRRSLTGATQKVGG